MLALEHPHHIPQASSSSSPALPRRDSTRRPPHIPPSSAAVAAPRPHHSSSSANLRTDPPRPQRTPSTFDIHLYPAHDLLRLLASLLVQIAAANDALPSAHTPEPSFPSPDALASRAVWHTLTSASRAALGTPSSPLSFHARNVPTIPLEAYLLRILKYCPTTNEVFLSLLVYFDRMARLANEATGRTFVIDSYNIHRLVIAGVTVASKFFSDVFYTNSRYAKVGGLPQSELNQLELQFLLLNDFRLMISEDEMQRYAHQLLAFSRTNAIAPSPSDIAQGPRRAMGAFDAFGGTPHSPPQPTSPRAPPLRRAASSAPLASPVRALSHSASTQSFASAASSSQDTETDGGGESTDEEPTIRPAWSVRSGSVSREQEDGDDDDDDDDDDARMASPPPPGRYAPR